MSLVSVNTYLLTSPRHDTKLKIQMTEFASTLQHGKKSTMTIKYIHGVTRLHEDKKIIAHKQNHYHRIKARPSTAEHSSLLNDHFRKFVRCDGQAKNVCTQTNYSDHVRSFKWQSVRRVK